MELAEKRYAQWLAQQGLEPELRQELDAMHSDAEKVTDAFYRDLEFGTAGLRGVLGAGTNRMNIYVIRRATQAVAQYLNETELPKTVAIGHDSRIKSDVFAREAAAVFAANGITAYLYPRLEPVPALSFAVRHLHCGLGVCVTASHNPAEYNGYKVYGSDGCQMTPEAAKRVVALLEHMDYFTSAKTTDFDAALAAGSIRYIPDEVLDAFVDAVYAQRVGSGEGIENLKLVYTPLNGAGLECVKKLTQKLGIRNMTIVKEQEQPDGHFPTCPYPNPEIRQAMELGLQYCDRVHPDILIGTDPDCDRCGTAVPDGKGGYRLISATKWASFCWTSSAAAASRMARCRKIPSLSPPLSRPIWSQPSPKNTASSCAACLRVSNISASRSRCWSRAAIRNAISSALRRATGTCPVRTHATRTRSTLCSSSARLPRGTPKRA